jgi:hypothetical protein
VLAYSVIIRRSARTALPCAVLRALIAVAVLALAINWTIKLVWLGV